MRAVGGCLSVPADQSQFHELEEEDAGCRGFLFGGNYDDWPTAKSGDSSGVRTGDAKNPSLCYYKYFFNVVMRANILGSSGIWSTNKYVSSGKATSVCSLLDVCVFSFVRSVGGLGSVVGGRGSAQSLWT